MNRELVIEPKNSSYAFCSDTCYHQEIISLLNNVTLLYHESTFLEIDNDIAKKHYIVPHLMQLKLQKRLIVKNYYLVIFLQDIKISKNLLMNPLKFLKMLTWPMRV